MVKNGAPMKRLQTICLCVMLTVVASCGGGGSPYVAKTSVTCSLPLAFSNITSGVPIPDNEEWSLSARNTISGCAIEGLETMRLNICLDHPVISDLEIRVFRDPRNKNTPISLSLTQTSGFACSIGGTAYQLNMNISPYTDPANLDGIWSVEIRDKRSGFGYGYFIGWSLEFKGYKR